ncbi:unnamed protein product, partial [Mesorhabditis spiculigera]
MFYWLTESKSDPGKDPLAVYYSGGPGCSSIGETFEEMGPFYVNRDGKSLYENVYAWNARANVLYMDSPISVGFSYDSANQSFNFATDEQTAQQNYNGMIDFFKRVGPEYAKRDFYLTGSSYSGVYQPMLAQLIVDGISRGTFPNVNFRGFAIGNGYLDARELNNALVMWSAYHGKVSIRDWERMKEVCYQPGVGRQYDMDSYDFTKFLHTDDYLDYRSDGSECGNMTMKIYEIPDDEGLNNYMYYQECWGYRDGIEMEQTSPLLRSGLTGPNGGDYKASHESMMQFFDQMIAQTRTQLKVLLYNGDVDTVCNYLGDARFAKRIAEKYGMQESERTRWKWRGQTAGWQQRYTGKQMIIDVLTVKGAGHFVPNDRGGASVQIISAFLNQDQPDYNLMEKSELPEGFAFPTSRYYPDRLRIRNQLARECLCEFICTFFFLLLGVGCVLQVKTSKGELGGFLSINLGWGLAVAFSCGMGIWLSGGHINPSVSLTQWFLGRLTLKQALWFSVAQTIGAFAGTACAYLNYIEALNDFDGGQRVAEGDTGSLCFLVTCPASYTSYMTGIFDQIIGTGVLTATMAAMLDKRNGVNKWLHPIFGGLSVMLIGMTFAKNDSYPINPARDLGARAFAAIIYGQAAFTAYNHWWWVPIVGPLIGGFVGGFVYLIFIDIHSSSNREERDRKIAPTDARPKIDGFTLTPLPVHKPFQ